MKDKMIVWCAATMCAVTAFSGRAPIRLRATDFVRATGNPSLVTWAKGAVHVPVWSLSGRTEGQSIAALTPPLPSDCTAVRVEIQVVNEDSSATNTFTDVYRAQIAQVADGRPLDWGFAAGKPVRTRLSAPGKVRTVVLETYRKVKPGLPLSIRIQREPDDPGDTFVNPAGLLSATITPLAPPAPGFVVQDVKGYNSWPMIQTVGNRLICTYSRGSAHTINEGVRDAYARTSDDGGRTWSPEVKFAADPQVGEVMIGKGVDNDGAALFWVRCLGRPRSHHDLYRTKDGVTFEKISEPALDPFPMQITDVFKLPGGKLMSLWFATNYRSGEKSSSWGTLTSTDNGRTWEQKTVEAGLEKGELPTEQSAVYLGNGRILALARTEDGGASTASQFQLTSTDDGATWTRVRTNIRDVLASTPSLIYDAKKGIVYNYYYERGRGVVKRRVVRVDDIWDNPLAWPDGEAVAVGNEERPHDAGNVNAVACGGRHYLSYYSGTHADTTVFVAPVRP